MQVNKQNARKSNASFAQLPKEDDVRSGEEQKRSCQEDLYLSVPLHVATSSGSAWVRSRKQDLVSSRIPVTTKVDPSSGLLKRTSSELKGQDIGIVLYGSHANSGVHDLYSRSEMQKHWSKFERLDSFDDSKRYHSQGLSSELYQRDELSVVKRSYKVKTITTTAHRTETM